ncbi:hypothetical protein AAY473_037271 [Plecturocebus cupreus]
MGSYYVAQLVSNSWAQVTLLLQPSKVLGLQNDAWYTSVLHSPFEYDLGTKSLLNPDPSLFPCPTLHALIYNPPSSSQVNQLPYCEDSQAALRRGTQETEAACQQPLLRLKEADDDRAHPQGEELSIEQSINLPKMESSRVGNSGEASAMGAGRDQKAHLGKA